MLRISVLVALPAVGKKGEQNRREKGREGKGRCPFYHAYLFIVVTLFTHLLPLLFLWCQVFSSLEIRIAMPHECNLFSAVNRDFRILMKATEKNPNVLQACSRISKFTVIY